MSQPRATTVDTNPAYPVAIQRLKEWAIICTIRYVPVLLVKVSSYQLEKWNTKSTISSITHEMELMILEFIKIDTS